VMRPARTEAEERDGAGPDPRLELVALRLRQVTARDGCVDAIHQCLLQRIAEGRRRHAELLRRVVHNSLAFLARGSELRRTDGDTSACDRERRACCDDQLPPTAYVHEERSFRVSPNDSIVS